MTQSPRVGAWRAARAERHDRARSTVQLVCVRARARVRVSFAARLLCCHVRAAVGSYMYGHRRALRARESLVGSFAPRRQEGACPWPCVNLAC